MKNSTGWMVIALLFVGCSSTDDSGTNPTGGTDVGEEVIEDRGNDLSDDVGKSIRDSSPECSFTLEAAMVLDEIGTWVIELTVTDSSGADASDTVSVDVSG